MSNPPYLSQSTSHLRFTWWNEHSRTHTHAHTCVDGMSCSQWRGNEVKIPRKTSSRACTYIPHSTHDFAFTQWLENGILFFSFLCLLPSLLFLIQRRINKPWRERMLERDEMGSSGRGNMKNIQVEIFADLLHISLCACLVCGRSIHERLCKTTAAERKKGIFFVIW